MGLAAARLSRGPDRLADGCVLAADPGLAARAGALGEPRLRDDVAWGGVQFAAAPAVPAPLRGLEGRAIPAPRLTRSPTARLNPSRTNLCTLLRTHGDVGDHRRKRLPRRAPGAPARVERRPRPDTRPRASR